MDQGNLRDYVIREYCIRHLCIPQTTENAPQYANRITSNNPPLSFGVPNKDRHLDTMI
jgi:hypothetical protein